ncbi:MAG TPA: heme exporter protein CcmB, partial [Anaerolineae bacterium]
MRLYIEQIGAIVHKDIMTEVRTREASTAMLVFAVMTIMLFNFALRLRLDSFKPLVPGILWVTLVFAGTLGLGHSMSAEQVNQCIDGLLMSPCDRSVIFMGKALSNVLFTLFIALIIVPLMAILFDETLFQPGVLLTVVAGVIGYA